MTITRRVEWDMGHRIQNHDSQCRNLHGHRYAALISVSGHLITYGPHSGMVMDFGRLKTECENSFLNEWDHSCMLQHNDPAVDALSGLQTRLVLVDAPPTAETIAEIIYNRLHAIGLPISSVTVYETPNCSATYRRTE